MKGYLIKFIAYACVTGLALGLPPEDIIAFIKENCKIPLTIDEKQALDDQDFPREGNGIKLSIIRHLFKRNHFYFSIKQKSRDPAKVRGRALKRRRKKSEEY